MKYNSLKDQVKGDSFKTAVIKGLAADRGLYFPETIAALEDSFFKNIDSYSNSEIAFHAIRQFIEPEIPDSVLMNIIDETLAFNFPVIQLNENISVLELFHGPTMAFKDVGARFMARCLGYFNVDSKNEVTVLVATSGDTGGAVAHGFLGVKGVKVVILYPSGKVSKIQEKQLTTLGQNITALEVDGTFDDCQDMVKTAFLDKDITTIKQLTSANSINVARWLPQMFYFLFTYKALYEKYDNIVYSVPSGNFGNICAGIMAQQLGMPVNHFIAANNINDVVTKYLRTNQFVPEQSKQTISNAMDVGNPSNFIRIQKIFKKDFNLIKENISSYSFTDDETKAGIEEIYKHYQYISDPHGAVGYLGAKEYLKENPDAHCVFLETAHPVKFFSVVEEVIEDKINLPDQIIEIINREKKSIRIDSYKTLKDYLLDS